MTLRQILTEPNEILRKKSLPVEKVDKDVFKGVGYLNKGGLL